MGEAAPVRKLTAILAADVAGYSRMMRADQSGTIDKLNLRREILDEAVARRRGRIANTAGDSVLAEFGSVVDALHCAIEIQGAVAQANERLPRDRHMSFRIGVHTGEVFVRGNDLLGDGVNVAARLQSMAPPGGIYTSAVVREQVRGILSLQFRDMGQQLLKNIRQPVRIFSVTSPPLGEVVLGRRDKRRFSRRWIATVLVLALIIGSGAATWWLHPPWLERWLPMVGNVTQAAAPPTAPVPAPRRTQTATAASPPTAVKAANTPPANTSDAVELALWQSTTAQGRQSAFEEYLRQYPTGHFAEAARAKIDELKHAAEGVAAAPAAVRAAEEAPLQLAQGIPFDCPKQGTVVAFSDGHRLTFGSRAGFRCHAVGGDGKEMDDYAGLVSIPALPSLAAEELEKFWPLREHADLSFSTRMPELAVTGMGQDFVSNRYRVVGTERLHVAAGDFDTVIVERILQAHSFLETIDVLQKLWYAPKIACVVKIVTQNGSTYTQRMFRPGQIEATEVTVP